MASQRCRVLLAIRLLPEVDFPPDPARNTSNLIPPAQTSPETRWRADQAGPGRTKGAPEHRQPALQEDGIARVFEDLGGVDGMVRRCLRSHKPLCVLRSHPSVTASYKLCAVRAAHKSGLATATAPECRKRPVRRL